MSFIFDNLAPSLNMRFKKYFKSFFESIPVQKTVSEVLKMWYFLYSAFWSAGQWGGGGEAISRGGNGSGSDPDLTVFSRIRI